MNTPKTARNKRVWSPGCNVRRFECCNLLRQKMQQERFLRDCPHYQQSPEMTRRCPENNQNIMKEYDNFSETFAKSRKNMHWPEIEYFLDVLGQPGKVNVLDIWCGSWRLLPYLGKALPDFWYLWIDSSSWMINEAKKEHPSYEFQTLDMTELDKIKTKFDRVFFIASFHHLDTPEKRLDTLIKLKNILSPDWIAYMTNWNLLWDRNFSKYMNAHRWNWDFDIKIWKHSRYYHSFSEAELGNLFSLSGFTVIENRVFEWGNNLISIIKA